MLAGYLELSRNPSLRGRVSTPPPVSVVMGVLNGLPHVESSVRSILEQSLTDFELVIGDDGSTDGTTELLRDLAASDSRIRLLRRESPSGLAGSANWVVREARAPLVAIAHADDRSHPDRLARQLALFEDHADMQLVGTLAEGIDDRGRVVRAPDFWRLTRHSAFAPFSHSSIMFRRAAFDAAGAYREEAEYWEDLDLYLRIAERGRIAVIPENLCSVRFGASSTRLTSNAGRVDAAIDLMYRSVADYLQHGEYPRRFPGAAAEGRAKLRPETFIGRGSVQLWSGRSPGVLKRMFRRAALGFDLLSLQVIIWTVWSTVSPRTMRSALRTLMRLRSWHARAKVCGQPFVAWDPALARVAGASPGRTKPAPAAAHRTDPIRASAWPIRPR